MVAAWYIRNKPNSARGKLTHFCTNSSGTAASTRTRGIAKLGASSIVSVGAVAEVVVVTGLNQGVVK